MDLVCCMFSDCVYVKMGQVWIGKVVEMMCEKDEGGRL